MRPNRQTSEIIQNDIAELVHFFNRHQRIFVLTGAGLSTASGIPDYRDQHGQWKRTSPITHQHFIRDEHARKRYWSRSMVGWKLMANARPNAGHTALAKLEHLGYLQLIVTQNVDGLHQLAGSSNLVELHGGISRCICLSCNNRLLRSALQVSLEALNPALADRTAGAAPDGDADLDGEDLTGFHIPDCEQCGGMLMPDVVFYGGSVPKTRVNYLTQQLAQADAMLVVGSTLTTYSAFRYCQQAAQQDKPVLAINLGKTRADNLLHCKIEQDCGWTLEQLSLRLHH